MVSSHICYNSMVACISLYAFFLRVHVINRCPVLLFLWLFIFQVKLFQSHQHIPKPKASGKHSFIAIFFFFLKKKNPTPLESFYILVTQTFICSHEKARLAYYIHNPQVLKLLQICHICRETCTLWRGVPGAHILDFVYETHGIRDDWNPRFLLFEKWKNSTSTTHSHPCHVEIFILFWWNHSVWH